MSDITLQLDLGDLEKLGEDFKTLERKIQEEAGKLATQVHAHIIEQAQEKLHSRRQIFMENLAFQQVDADTWVVTVKEKAMWIEEGLPPHDMVENLLGDNPKVSKDGHRYRVIPFEHSKGPTQQTSAAKNLTDTIKKTLSAQKIPYQKIERDDKGRPKTGLLHKLDITDKPLKTHDGPGQGHGPIGQVKQGSTGTPWLQGIRIYQKALFNDDGTPKLDKQGQQQAKRSIMTFRVVSSEHKGEKWQYPGIEASNFLGEAEEWAKKEWEERILPDLMKQAGID